MPPLVVLSDIYTGEELFIPRMWSHQGAFMLVTNKKQEKVGSSRVWYFRHIIMLAFVHDVTDTDCWAQNGSTHGRVFTTLKRRFLTNRRRNCIKTCGVYILFLSIRPVMLPRFGFLFNTQSTVYRLYPGYMQCQNIKLDSKKV